MSDFLSFDTFITPKIIRIVFVLGLLLIALGALIRVVIGIWSLSILSGVILPLIGACVVALLWRIYCRADPGVLRYARQVGGDRGAAADVAPIRRGSSRRSRSGPSRSDW